MELTSYQKRLLEMYPAPRMFALISWGCAGTSWLARALNSHREVFCVHAANVYWNSLGQAPYVDGADYLRIIGAQGYSHRLAGDVHGVSRTSIPAITSEYGDRFRAAVIIREPIARLLSQLALMNFYSGHHAWNIGYIDSFSASLNIDVASLPYERKLRLHAINMLNAITDEVAVGPVYRIEDLGQSDVSFSSMLDWISAGTLNSNPAWLQSVFSIPRTNSHVQRTSTALTEEDRHALRRIVKDETWSLYEKFGYLRPQL